MTSPRKIFVDMDGTLAEWRTDVNYEEVLKPGYFANLRPQMGVVNLLRELDEKELAQIFILGCVIPNGHAKKEKLSWLEKFCPFIPKANIIFIKDGCNKNSACQSESDILLDDYSKNLHEWSGVGVKVMNGVNGHHGSWHGRRFNINDDVERMIDAILS